MAATRSPRPSIPDLLRDVDRRLRAAAVPARREVATWYFPTRLEVIGVPVPAMRAVACDAARRLRDDDADAVLALARRLHAAATMEGRAVAYEVLSRHPRARAALTTRAVEELGRGNDNWGTVDVFATLIAGPAWREGRVTDAAVRRWARSRDRWWRRTALAATVALNVAARGGHGDRDRTLATCRALAADRDDMVVKALSWALRSLVAHDPGAVRGFVTDHGKVLHPRVRREVGRKLATGTKAGRRR